MKRDIAFEDCTDNEPKESIPSPTFASLHIISIRKELDSNTKLVTFCIVLPSGVSPGTTSLRVKCGSGW